MRSSSWAAVHYFYTHAPSLFFGCDHNPARLHFNQSRQTRRTGGGARWLTRTLKFDLALKLFGAAGEGVERRARCRRGVSMSKASATKLDPEAQAAPPPGQPPPSHMARRFRRARPAVARRAAVSRLPDVGAGDAKASRPASTARTSS